MANNNSNLLNKLAQILEASEEVDERFKKLSPEDLSSFQLSFPVPKEHNRASVLESYPYSVRSLIREDFIGSTVVADVFAKNVVENLEPEHIHYINSIEGKTKEIKYLDAFIEEHKEDARPKIVAVGGNLVLNVVAYIAEKLQAELVHVPTSVIAMSDGSMGGKVRANKVEGGSFFKHFYKSFYEPNLVIVDPQFLETLSNEQISDGLSEIVKHGIFQSQELLAYLNSGGFNPYEDKRSLLKAILWTASLKKICLDIDPDENKDGSYVILRGGHDRSDKIEEERQFNISHGAAVAIGLWEYCQENYPNRELVENIYQRFSLRKVI